MLGATPRPEAKSASLWIHGREVDEEELLLSIALLEELQLKPGDFVEIDFAETPETRSASPARDKSPPSPPPPPSLSSGEQTLVLRVPEAHRPPSKSALQISVQRPVAEAFQLCNRQPVLLRQVRAEDVALDWVELVFKEQYMSRGDIWHFRRHLLERAPALYVGKVCAAPTRRAATTYCPPPTAHHPPPTAHHPLPTATTHHLLQVCEEEGARAQVQAMVRRGAPVESGVLNADTVLSFRSRCASFVLLIQMSDEMWGFAPDGELYHEKAVTFLRALFQRWAELGVSHSLTLVLFSRSYAPKHTKGSSHAPQGLMRDAAGRTYTDHYNPNPNPDPNPDPDPNPNPNPNPNPAQVHRPLQAGGGERESLRVGAPVSAAQAPLPALPPLATPARRRRTRRGGGRRRRRRWRRRWRCGGGGLRRIVR